MPKHTDIPAQIRAAVREYVKARDPDAHAEAVRIAGLVDADVTWGPFYAGEEGPDGETMPDDYNPFDYADKLRALLTAADVPGFYDPDAGCFLTAEPEGGWYNDDGEPCDAPYADEEDADDAPHWRDPEPYYSVEIDDVITAYLRAEVARNVNLI
jgi:hypothetical protein